MLLSDLDSKVMEIPTMVDLRGTLPWHPTRRWSKKKNVDLLVIHHTGSDNQDPFNTNAYHISKDCHISPGKGCPRICYADYITKDGTIYHCNDYSDSTWHAGLVNSRSIGVVIAHAGEGFPPLKQYDALLQLLTKLCCYLGIPPVLKNVKGHREVPGFYTLLGKGSTRYKTVCPGMGIDLDKLRRELTVEIQTLMRNDHYYMGKVDGLFGPESQRAFTSFGTQLTSGTSL